MVTIRQGRQRLPCRSLRGNVDRNTSMAAACEVDQSRSLRGNVDRNNKYGEEQQMKGCRSLRGNVDRNLAIIPSCADFCASFPTWERG